MPSPPSPILFPPSPTPSLGPQPTQPLPWAGALPVGGRAGRVHALVAASGVEAHLARPTLHTVLLTLIDVCGGRGDGEGEKGVRRRSKGEGQKHRSTGMGPWERDACGASEGAAPAHLSPASLTRDSPAHRALAAPHLPIAPRMVVGTLGSSEPRVGLERRGPLGPTVPTAPGRLPRPHPPWWVPRRSQRTLADPWVREGGRDGAGHSRRIPTV